MILRPSSPGADDWLMAVLRSLHPVRWLWGLVGVAALFTLAPVVHALLGGGTPRWGDWWADPIGQVRATADLVAGRSFGAAFVRLGAVLGVAVAAWCLVGGWIARHELLARQRARPGGPHPWPEPGPTRLVVTRAKDLVLAPVMVLLLVALALVPVLVAGRVNAWLGGIGAVIVAILLPIVLLANLIVLLLAIGALAWPLMPVTIATETSDVFDALSRSYNYAVARPMRFLLFLALAVGLAGLPLLAAVQLMAAGPVLGWLAAGLSVSIFWSLLTLVYLHMRTAVDGVDASEIADGSDGMPEPAPPAGAAKAAPPAQGNRFVTMLIALVLVTGTWLFTAWVFPRVGGESAGWLGWGLGEQFAPPAEGLYRLASRIGFGWGVLCLSAPFVVALRPRRPDAPAAGHPAP